jgi:hypothetical protein
MMIPYLRINNVRVHHLSLLLFPHSLYIYIGKSIDPAGSKVGEKQKYDATVTVDDDYIEGYINMWDYWTKNTSKTQEDAIAAISPYVASKREDTYLHLLSDTLECLPDEVVGVNKMMKTWIGRYDEMFVMVDNHIREKEKEAHLLENTPMVTDNDDLSTSQSITGPPLQITGGSPSPPTDVIEMDTREKSAKRSRDETALTRGQSKLNLEAVEN